MLYIFSKTDCGPCILVKKYFKTMNDPRTEEVKEILLDDGQEENIEFARKYKITATPTLIVVENEEKIEEYVGGVPIKYSDQLGDTL
jgi:thioredoxin-related protein